MRIRVQKRASSPQEIRGKKNNSSTTLASLIRDWPVNQVDHPILSVEWSQPGGEGLGLSEELQVSMEVELAITEGLLERVDELAAKDFTQHLFREEVIIA